MRWARASWREISLVLFVVFSAAFFLAFAFGMPRLGAVAPTDPGPAAVPILLSLLLLGTAAAELCWSFRGTSGQDRAPDAEPPANLAALGLVAGWLAIYVLALPYLGFTLSTPVFAVVAVRRLGASWWLSCLAAILLVAVVRGLFVAAFHVPWPEGWGWW